MSEIESSEQPQLALDPRTEVSADAYHIAKCARTDAREASARIVKHMWIIFVLLPVVIAILFLILSGVDSSMRSGAYR